MISLWNHYGSRMSYSTNVLYLILAQIKYFECSVYLFSVCLWLVWPASGFCFAWLDSRPNWSLCRGWSAQSITVLTTRVCFRHSYFLSLAQEYEFGILFANSKLIRNNSLNPKVLLWDPIRIRLIKHNIYACQIIKDEI